MPSTNNGPNLAVTQINATFGQTPDGTVIFDRNNSTGLSGQVLTANGDNTLSWVSTSGGNEIVSPDGTTSLVQATNTGINVTTTGSNGLVTTVGGATETINSIGNYEYQGNDSGGGFTVYAAVTDPNGYIEFSTSTDETTFFYLEDGYIESTDSNGNNIVMDSSGIELSASLPISVASANTVQLTDGAGSSISLTNDTNVNVNCGGIFSVSSSIGIQPPQWSKTSLPALNTGAVIYVTDATRTSGTGTLAFCDGTNWVDVTTGLPIS